jgi:nitrogen PTS system EIIA component
MQLDKVFRPECFMAQAALDDKAAAIEAVADAAARFAGLHHVSRAQLLAAFLERERLCSTGVGGGVAIPHCRLAEACEFVAGVITAPAGVAFDAVDSKPVQALAFVVGPQTGAGDYMRLLAAVAQALSEPGAVAELVKATDAAGLRAALLGQMRAEAGASAGAVQCLVQVIVQDEPVFREIVAVFTALAPASFVVVEAQNAGAYLASMPLYRGFWAEASQSLSNVVLARMERPLTEELVRRIEARVGTLDDKEGLLLLVQELQFAAGKLRA